MQHNFLHYRLDSASKVIMIIIKNNDGQAVELRICDNNTDCPSGWRETGYSKRKCGRASYGQRTCDSVTFPVSGGRYSQVCGGIKVYQGRVLEGSVDIVVDTILWIMPTSVVWLSCMAVHNSISGHL